MTVTSEITEEEVRLGQRVLSPTIKVEGQPIAQISATHLRRVVVDVQAGMPDMVELTWLDPGWGILAEAGLALGKKISVEAGTLNERMTKPLIEAEITAIEGVYGHRNSLTVVRGYTLDHRLQRVRRTRTFVNAKDSDVARQLASDAGLVIGTIEATTQVHPQIAQDNQTDWQLLRERANEIGYEMGVVEGKFHFIKAATVQSGTEIPVTGGKNLLNFSPRISSAGLVPEVEVRAWDPVNAKAIAARKPIASSNVCLGVGDAAEAARLFSGKAKPPAGAASELGPAPSSQAQVVYDRAVTVDSSSTQAVTQAATALAQRAAAGFAEAEGEILGDARVIAGAILKIDGVPEQFAGKWTVARARHEFDHRPGGGYRTHFSVHGQQDRSLFHLTSAGSRGQSPTRIQGVVGAVVTSLDDPLGLARVKVALPWLSPEYETAWAPVVQLIAGKNTGAMFLPEPGDQVLVSFEFGDVRRPYVIGSVVNKRTGAGGVLTPGAAEPGKAAIKAGKPSTVAWRGLKTPTGSRLAFHDEAPPGGGKPTASEIYLGTADDKLGVTFDAVKGELRIACTPGSPPGRLTIECDGNVEIKAGSSGTMTIDGGQMLTLKGKAIQIEGSGPVAVKGKPVQLN